MGYLFHCICNRRNVKCKIPQEPFRHSGYRDFERQGFSPPVHLELPKCEMRKEPLNIGIGARLVVTWGDRKSCVKCQSVRFSYRRCRYILQVPIQLSLNPNPC
jgi:hypothetical protein